MEHSGEDELQTYDTDAISSYTSDSISDSSSLSDWDPNELTRGYTRGKIKSKSNLDECKRPICEVCQSATATDVAELEKTCAALKKTCAKCHRCVHVYCSCYPLPDDVEVGDELPAQYCQFCSAQSVYNHESQSMVDTSYRVLDMRGTYDAGASVVHPIEYFSAVHNKWMKRQDLEETDIRNFMDSFLFRRVLARANRSGLAIVHDDKVIHINEKGIQRSCTIRKFRHLNGTYIGVTQIIGYFDAVSLKMFREKAEKHLRNIQDPMNPMKLKAKTVEMMAKNRIKVFLGYRYDYGKNRIAPNECQRLFDDVDSISKFSLVGALQEILTRDVRNDLWKYLELPGPGFFNQALMVFYLKSGSGLGSHKDSEDLFQRPIVSIRLISDSVLSFNRRGLGCQSTPQSFSISQSIGTVTVLERFAADNATHCVLRSDLKALSMSIVFRAVQASALDMISPY